MKKIILLIGMPGSGKGSIGKLCEQNGYVHISSSNLLTQAGYDITNSSSITSETVIELIKNAISLTTDNKTIIIEGFPRSMEQLQKLEQEFDVYKAIYLKIHKNIALLRVLDRLVCTNCGEIYTSNEYKSPKNSEICDICGFSLERRGGDNKKIFNKRLGYFFKNTTPIIDYYYIQKKLVVVDATKSTEEIFKIIKSL